MIYLDNAATSFPKPQRVCDEMDITLRYCCGNPGRGDHTLSVKSAEKIYDCRVVASEFLGCTAPENIIFTHNATHALNMAIKGILTHGDHVIISDIEHNSVVRPISHLARNGVIEYDVFPSMMCDPLRSTSKICTSIAKLLRPNTRMIICTHASNICSYTLPIKDIGALCLRHNIIFAVDASQSAGHLPLNMKEQNIDILCLPGHKGLLGPQGSGILAIRQNLQLSTLTEGGNGINSLEEDMPEFAPERYESGTLSVPSITGLREGIEIVKEIGVSNIHEHSKRLFCGLVERLRGLKQVKIYLPSFSGSVFLFNIRDMPSNEVSRLLDKHGICTRSGLHCSPSAHKLLETVPDGAVRVSFGIYNTMQDIDELHNAVRDIVK